MKMWKGEGSKAINRWNFDLRWPPVWEAQTNYCLKGLSYRLVHHPISGPAEHYCWPLKKQHWAVAAAYNYPGGVPLSDSFSNFRYFCHLKATKRLLFAPKGNLSKMKIYIAVLILSFNPLQPDNQTYLLPCLSWLLTLNTGRAKRSHTIFV